MRIVFVISFFLLSFSSMTQDLILRSFVKEDTVQLRWFPTSAEVMQNGLKNGYELKQGGSSSNSIRIAPWSERRTEYANSNDSLTSVMSEFIDDFVTIGSFESSGSKSAFGLLSLSSSAYVKVAKLLGCYHEVLGLNGKYNFVVSSGGSVSEEVQVNTKKLDQNHAFTELKGSSRIDLVQANLEWEAKELNPWYGGYYIYKSKDNKTFIKLNELPLFHFTSEYEAEKSVIDFVDKDVEEGGTYFYKVQPINHFGDPGIESNIIEVYIQKRLNGLCIIDTVKMDEFNRKILGHYRSDVEDEIVSFSLFRSDSVNMGYELLETTKENGDLSFEFDYKVQLTSGDRHYFMVAAVGSDGDSVYSFPYYHFSLDQIPPGLPTDLQGVIDSSGVAKLTWNAPDDKDIRGYRVYRANSLKEEFVEVTEFYAVNGQYRDTISLNNLTSEIYYKIRAVDMNYNNGPITEPVKLLKPDTIAPVPPSLRKYEVKEEGIKLIWHNSPSEDVFEQILIRQLEGEIDSVYIIENDQTEFTDTTCLLGRHYTYWMSASDESSNWSESRELRATYEIGYRPAPKGFKGEANIKEKRIELEWNTIMDEIYSIQIYRAKNEGKFRLYETIRENVDVYEDDDLSINNQYRYKIKVMYKSGISSKMSEEIKVMY